jgi:hypothetical protein
MKDRLLIWIGGSGEQNGDYSLVHQRAQRGGTTNWSSLKDARPGDWVLIYIQRPHSALIAKADVLARAAKGKPGDYAHRPARLREGPEYRQAYRENRSSGPTTL